MTFLLMVSSNSISKCGAPLIKPRMGIVWVLQYESYNAADTAPWLAAGKQQWWYHCIEPSDLNHLNTFIERPLIQHRLLFWLAACGFLGCASYAESKGAPSVSEPWLLSNVFAKLNWLAGSCAMKGLAVLRSGPMESLSRVATQGWILFIYLRELVLMKHKQS